MALGVSQKPFIKQWKVWGCRMTQALPFLPQRFRHRMQRRLDKYSRSISGLQKTFFSREVLAQVADLVGEFAPSDMDVAQLQNRRLEMLSTAPELPEALAQGWRRLYLSLDRLPDALLIVPSLDDPRLLRHLLCLCNQAIASGSAEELLVIAADETRSSVALHLPCRTVWRSLAEFHNDLNFEQRVAILTALIHNLRPQATLVVESEVGWEVIARRGSTVRQYSNLFAMIVSSGHTASTYEQRLPQCLGSFAAIYTDDEKIIGLDGREGFSSDACGKFRLLPSEVSDEEWVSVMSSHPGFLAKKKVAHP